MVLNNLFLKNNKVQKILKEVKNGNSVKVSGLVDSGFAFFCGNIFSELNKNILLITYSRASVDLIYENLLRLQKETTVMQFPEVEVLPHEQINIDYHVKKGRLKVMQEALFSQEKKIIIVEATALLRKMVPANLFKTNSLTLKLGKEIKRDMLTKRLFSLGYQREKMVAEPGHFSVRGGIIDIFTFTADNPCRIEFFGDEIDSIREFNLATQRSTVNIETFVIPPADEIIILPEKINEKLPVIKNEYEQAVKRLHGIELKEEAQYLEERGEEVLEKLKEFNDFPGYRQFLPYFYDKPSTLFDYLPDNFIIFIDRYSRVEASLKNFNRELNEMTASLLEQGSVLPTYPDNFLSFDEIFNIISSKKVVYFTEEFYKNSVKKEKVPEVSFSSASLEPYHGQLELFSERLRELIKDKYRILITLNTEVKVKKLREYLLEKNLPVVRKSTGELARGKIFIENGSFSEGFLIKDHELIVYTEKEVFGKKQKTKKQLTDLEQGVKISSLNELNTGDYVVHENHGIGKYLGIKSMEVQNQHQDYLVIKYSGGDKLYVPTDQVDLVQKYVGADDKAPKLYKLGGNEWQRVKEKVKKSVEEMAIELLELYAERETVKGYSFSGDTVWQKEFEEAFPYTETPDQIKAIQEVKQDMESRLPMDRLLCGDVGYGKTEVAIRAAFKAAVEGKQTAVLVPTTILAQQHYNTFRERIDEFPVMVEMLSRFRTAKEQREILKKVASGKIDIIIGTHRLLSDDIFFKDLGLLIIDEEQRFGVTHKEKIKNIKRNVDVLTLTATPIPRTLHMALAGVRDMSVIETPPENRYPIRTYIREYNAELLKEAIRREMDRDGQIYFVHNRVKDIEEKAAMLRKLVPEANIAVAHGQMNENRLERLMFNFYNQEYDVLVCTTIIETGLDIPNVNTIIINRAEQMGLAQLYQLRGRVGRTDRIAYAYLVYKKDKILPEVAEKRLKAIKEFTNLGSGFKIAMRDLEIRGAGNLLGAEQHGHIASIGFSLYCKLLEGAVEELRGKKQEKEEIEINLKIDAYIPDKYIPDSAQKIEIYKKIESIKKEEDIIDIVDEMIDRFGDIPLPVSSLLDICWIRIKARELSIEKVVQKDNLVNLHFENMERLAGTSIMELIEKYRRKIKIKSAKKPVIGIKTTEKNKMEFLKKIIGELAEIISVSA